MVVYDCNYDPVRDLVPVDQHGFMDLKSAFANSCVPSVMPDSDVDYNGVDNPDSILGTPRDIFEAIDAQRAVQQAATVSDESDDGKDS